MNELMDFLTELQKRSQDLTRDGEWTVLRPLSDSEVQQLWDIDTARAEFDCLKAEIQYMIPEERRERIRNRKDLSDDELELLGRFMLAKDVSNATLTAFWSPVRYEFRAFEQLMIDPDNALLLGRGNNRSYAPPLEAMGLPKEDEIKELIRLFGD